MRRAALPLLLMFVSLLLVSCGPAASSTLTPSTPQSEPTAVPAELPTESPVLEPTPPSVPEWEVTGVLVDGSTVTVRLRPYAGAQLEVTLGGKPPASFTAPGPEVEFVFHDVVPGTHALRVVDGSGRVVTDEVLVANQAYSEEFPQWLADLIQELEAQPPTNPPQSIWRYQYQGQTVFYLTAPCCDFFTDLYDASGNLLAHPDGGITGSGDGRAADFVETRSHEFRVWQDVRLAVDSENELALAPIEQINLNIAESFPLQYFVAVVYGLPNGCTTPAGYTVTRDESRILVRVYNQHPSDQMIACTMIYGIKEVNVALGSDFDPDTVYTVDVNGRTLSFQGDRVR